MSEFTPSKEMVSVVAEAIWNSTPDQMAEVPWSALDSCEQEEWMQSAKAAIIATREFDKSNPQAK